MDRRDFIKSTAILATVQHPAIAPSRLLEIPQDDWDNVRRQFLMAPDRIYLNVGTLGAQPRPVVDAVIEATRKTAETFPPGVKWDEINKLYAAIVDCDPESLSFTRNTTESMNFIANGLDWNAGDHIITTNHEHIGGLCCWQLISKRHKVDLTQVDISPAPMDQELVFKQLTKAVTPKTRLMSVSHVNFTTGLVMPVMELSRWCRERNIIFVIDGAHPAGLMKFSIKDIDPDFYGSSPHKWLHAPQGTGALYVRKEWRDKLWPTEASGDWDNLKLGMQRFNHLGTIDESRYAGFLAAMQFHNALGPERVHARIKELRLKLFDELSKTMRVVSPRDGAGMVSFQHPRIAALELQKKLGEKNIRTRVISEYGYGYMRLSPNVYTSTSDVDRVVGLINSF